jgi:hypothetical protein
MAILTRRTLPASRLSGRQQSPGRINHPLVGELDLPYETLALPGEPDLLLVNYLADVGSPTEERLALLASWTADAVTAKR